MEIGDLVGLAGADQIAVALSPEHRGLAVDRLRDRTRIRELRAEQLMEGTLVDKHVHWLHYLPDTSGSLRARVDAVADQVARSVPVLTVRAAYHTYVDAIRDGSFDPLRYLD